MLTTPLLIHLRASFPGAEIHLLANDYNAWVVADEPAIDRRWIYRRVRQGRRIDLAAAWGILVQNSRLRAERFDACIVANGTFSHRAIARGIAVKAARVVAYLQDEPARSWPGLTDALVEPSGVHEVERLLALAVPLGAPMPTPSPDPRYRLPDAVAKEAQRWLAERSLVPSGYVVIGLGARRAKKQPATRQVLSWAARLREQFGLQTVFMWTPGRLDDPRYPGDDDIAQPVLDARMPCIHPFRGPVQPAVGLIWHARTSLFPDSGLMHFAAASPGGVLGFFAETSVSPPPSQWAPRGPRAGYLEAEHSVADLSDDEVFRAMARQLEGSLKPLNSRTL